jgi:hypothetical protein
MTDSDTRSIHVDRTEEMARFRDMVTGAGAHHILLIRADRGMGKSSLLREFWSQGAGLMRTFVDFKPRTHSVEAVLGELGSQNRPAFKTFFDLAAQLISPGGVYISRSEISKSNFDVQLQTGPETAEKREMRRQALTQTFFADLLAANPQGKPVIAMFDTYENASEDVRDWFSRLFLTGAREHRWLTVIVAGRQIPDLGIGWDDWCLEQTLRPLGPEHVGEYVSRVQLSLSDATIATIYEGTKGIPLDVSTFVGNILHKRESRGE